MTLVAFSIFVGAIIIAATIGAGLEAIATAVGDRDPSRASHSGPLDISFSFIRPRARQGDA